MRYLTKPEDESYALCLHRAERMEFGREKDMRKTATRIVPLEILDDAPRTLLRPSKSFCFSPILRFSRNVFYERLAFSRRFVLPSTPNGATRREIVSRSWDLSPNFADATRDPGEKLCCLWRIDTRGMRRKNAVCEVLTREFLGWIKNMRFKRYVSRE